MAKSLSEAVKNEVKTKFDLAKFKDKKQLNTNLKFKTQDWIPFTDALSTALSIPGIPMGHVTMVRGRSDTGKTTILIEAATSAQKKGVLPVFIITEMKWDFKHAKKMGFQVNEVFNEATNSVEYEGFFLYVDRSSLNTIEDVAAFIVDLLGEQKKGNLPFDLLFLWDSVGSIPCNMSVDQGKNNPMWNAGAMATQFGNFINQQFPLSRKESNPYTNTLLIINKVGVQPPETFMSQPRMTNKGGDTMYWDSTLVITFGNVTNSGTSKLKAIKDKKHVEFAKRTKIAIDKYHLDSGIATRSTVVVTPHGFIDDTDKAVNDYKKQYSADWFAGTSNGEIKIVEDLSEWEETKVTNSLLEPEE
jgi:hypothetical protein